MIIEVSNRHRNTYKHRAALHKLGLEFNSSEKKWYKETEDKFDTKEQEKENRKEIRKILRFCRWHGLYCVVYPKAASRSEDYRTQFMKYYPTRRGKYRCAYCFRRISPSQTQVDHIIPVDKAKKSKLARTAMEAFGYSSVNDVRNLAPSCKKCNLKKGTKAGLWVIRGHLGKLKYYPYVYWGGAALLLWLCIFELVTLVATGNLSFAWFEAAGSALLKASNYIH